MRQLVSIDEHFDETRHDDLWLLRFILSHVKSAKASDVAAAAKAARSTLAWRASRGMDEINRQLQTMLSPDEHPNIAEAHASHVSPNCCYFAQPDETRGPVILVALTGLDFSRTQSYTYLQR